MRLLSISHGVIPGRDGASMRHFRTAFYSHLANSLDYQESEQIDPIILNGLVDRLRSGDTTVIPKIIKGHLRMVMGIVGETVRAKRKVDDGIGAALLALTKAVVDAQYTLYDNNITYYITDCVKKAIKDEMANDHTVRVPNRTIRDKISKGAKFEDIVPGDAISIQEDTTNDSFQDDGTGEAVRGKGLSHALPFHIPIAKPVCESAEFKEAIKQAARTPIEQAIIRLRAEGYGYEEIGPKVGYGKSMICKIMAEIEARFSRLYDSV